MSDKIQKSDFISLRVFFPLKWTNWKIRPIGVSGGLMLSGARPNRGHDDVTNRSLKKSHTKEDLPQSEKNIFFSIFYDFRDLRKIEIEKRKLRILEAGDFD